MDALLYTRVSTDEQVKFGLSLDAQKKDLEEYCKTNGLTVKKIYSDEGISGGSIKKRKAFQKMIAEAVPNDTILFTKLDRFSRNLLDANMVVKELEKKNVSIKAIHEDDIDTTTADGKFIFNLKLSLAEREREKTSERIHDVYVYSIKNGLSTSGSVPFGYKRVDKKYEIDTEKAPMIQELFNYYDKHQNIIGTLRWWNEKYPQYKMDASQLRKFRLSNTFYIGVHPSGLNDNFCEPIIEKEQFDRVNERLKKNIKHRKNNRIYLFSGIIVCAECGRRYGGQHNICRGHENYMYKCNNAHQNSLCSNKKMITEQVLEKRLLAMMEAKIGNPAVDVKVSPKLSPREKLQNAKNKASAKLTRLTELYVDGMLTRQEFDLKYKELQSDLQKINDKLESLQEPTAIKELRGTNFKELYAELSRENKQIFWHHFIRRIYFDGDNLDVIYY